MFEYIITPIVMMLLIKNKILAENKKIVIPISAVLITIVIL